MSLRRRLVAPRRPRLMLLLTSTLPRPLTLPPR
jgi:hypothetical protein